MRLTTWICFIAGVALCRPEIAFSQTSPGARSSGPIALGVALNSNTILPLMTLVGDTAYNCWPPKVDSDEAREVRLPMALQAIPPGWIAPAFSFPPDWTVFSATGEKEVVRSREVVTEDVASTFPIVAVRTTTGPAQDRDGILGVAVSSAAEVDVNFVRTIDSASAEGKRLTTIAKSLVLDEIIKRIATEKKPEELDHEPFRPSAAAVRAAEPEEVTIRRPERVLSSGTRPVFVDYINRYGPATGCQTIVHVASSFVEGGSGTARPLASDVSISFWCDYLDSHSIPAAIVRVGTNELWLGTEQYEDGAEYTVYTFAAGRLSPALTSCKAK